MPANQLPSRQLCRDALEVKLRELAWDGDTSWTNKKLNTKDGKPRANVPYRKVYVMFATPFNNENTNGFREQGYMQVSLFFPADKGTAAADKHSQLIRDHFPRMLSLPLGGLVVQIEGTPSIEEGPEDGDRYHIFVKVPFFAEVPNTNL